MKKFGQFLQERQDYPPLDRAEREQMVPRQPKQHIWRHKENGRLYVMIGSPFLDGGEWWVLTHPVEIQNGDLVRAKFENGDWQKLLTDLEITNTPYNDALGGL